MKHYSFNFECYFCCIISYSLLYYMLLWSFILVFNIWNVKLLADPFFSFVSPIRLVKILYLRLNCNFSAQNVSWFFFALPTLSASLMFNSKLWVLVSASLFKAFIFFINDATQLKFLSHLMTCTNEILQSGIHKLDYICFDLVFSMLNY